MQANIVGCIFLRMLLIPGICFFVGGLKYSEQRFEGRIVSITLFPTLASIMILVAPTALHSVTVGGLEAPHESKLLSLSCAVVLLLIHAANLLFQLKTHTDVFDDVDAMEEDLDSVEPDVNVRIAAFSLLLTLVLITICAHNLIRSLPPIVENSGIHRPFIGFVLLPFLSNTFDLYIAALVAYKGSPDLALSVCMSGIMQTALFVMPVLVIIGATIHHPLTLYFGRWEIVAVLFASILLAAVLQRGSSNYLDGLLCLGFYSIVVIRFLVLPKEVHSSEIEATTIIQQISN